MEKGQCCLRYGILTTLIGLILFVSVMGLASAQEETDEEIETEDMVAELPDPGILPNSAFYGIKRAFERIGDTFTVGEERRTERDIKLAEKRLSEAEAMAERGDTEHLESLNEEYERRIERANERASQSGEDRREQVTERVANATSRHLNILDEIYDKVPEEAREGITKARNNSMKGNQEALRALAEENPEKSAEIAMATAEKRAERIRTAADREDNEEIRRASEEYESYSEFGGEISSIAQRIRGDSSAVDELVSKSTSRHLDILDEVRERVPEEARHAIDQARERSMEGRDSAIRSLEENGREVPEEARRSAEKNSGETQSREPSLEQENNEDVVSEQL